MDENEAPRLFAVDSPPEAAAERMGVVVFSYDLPDGTTQISYEGLGGIDPLTIPTLLEIGYRVARKSLNLPNMGD